MKSVTDRYLHHRWFLPAVISLVVLCALSLDGFSQDPPPPPRPVVATAIQPLGFGAFTHGLTGGTITINANGSRSASGDVIPLNLGVSFSAATFQLVANPGTVISILDAITTLTGSNGGSMTLHTGASNPASPFVLDTTPPASTLMNLGGTLTVGNSASNPPGNYTGTFDITFIQE